MAGSAFIAGTGEFRRDVVELCGTDQVYHIYKDLLQTIESPADIFLFTKFGPE